MGRIADAVLSLLAAGPLGADRLGAELTRAGVTRARDPAGAVRRAVRDDRRVIELPDGRLASVAQALDGLALTAEVSPADAAAGAACLERDLAPLEVAGVAGPLPLPRDARAGDTVVVRVTDATTGAVTVELARGPAPAARPGDERELVAAVAARLAGEGTRRPHLAPPVTHLGAVVAGVAAGRPGALREAGRPLTRVLADAGYEVHLGWVGPRGTPWASLTDEEAAVLEQEVDELMADERPDEAAEVQARLLGLLARHAPERAPAARRALARMLARAGRPDEALGHLRASFGEGDPENWYEAALIALRSGDEVSARRWAESGLAHAAPAAEVAECLADIAGDLDAQAAFMRGRAAVVGGEAARDREAASRLARAIVAPGRSYLVEAMAEEVAAAVGPDGAPALLTALAATGEDGREACLALSVVLPHGLGRAARDAAGRLARPRPAVAGLLGAHPAAAWATSPIDAPDQQQLVITVAKEEGRVSPLVVLVDLDGLGGAVKDAFFLPDVAGPRLRRELFATMDAVGLPPGPVDLDEAIALVQVALLRTADIGWTIPSLRHQPVLDRIERWLLRPQRGDPGRRPVPGS
ncbi:hypothetical protein [Miltoncostaea marina]|uniref:hypothetical protein n=1 Tax=Miltoncostaea marina TaxID=2843215 RepID=UPI001C3C6C6B|nr:hypothetical protein [Miltoncostaea marina]